MRQAADGLVRCSHGLQASGTWTGLGRRRRTHGGGTAMPDIRSGEDAQDESLVRASSLVTGARRYLGDPAI